MSDRAKRGTGTKARPKKPSGNARPAVKAAARKPARPKPAKAKLAARPLAATGAATTIHVSYPTPSVCSCANPFQALGTAAATTQMAVTATIQTPNGTLTGTLDANPPPPFTWSYTFTDPLPQGVPLTLVVTGTTSTGSQEQAVVPFQCQ
jgi:hypothetical protein